MPKFRVRQVTRGVGETTHLAWDRLFMAVKYLEEQRRTLHDNGYDCMRVSQLNGVDAHGYHCVSYDDDRPVIELTIVQVE